MAGVFLDNIPFPDTEVTDLASNFALGRLMTVWAQIETMCGFMFRELVDLPREHATIVFERVGTREQVEMLEALAELRPEGELTAKLGAVLGKVQAISVKRNKVVHARWGGFGTNPFEGESARFWIGLTSKNIDDIVRETDKGKAWRARAIFTVSDLNLLFEEAIGVRKELEAAFSAVSRENNDARSAKMRAEAERRTPQWPGHR